MNGNAILKSLQKRGCGRRKEIKLTAIKDSSKHAMNCSKELSGGGVQSDGHGAGNWIISPSLARRPDADRITPAVPLVYAMRRSGAIRCFRTGSSRFMEAIVNLLASSIGRSPTGSSVVVLHFTHGKTWVRAATLWRLLGWKETVRNGGKRQKAITNRLLYH